jgi:hypothetical protein
MPWGYGGRRRGSRGPLTRLAEQQLAEAMHPVAAASDELASIDLGAESLTLRLPALLPALVSVGANSWSPVVTAGAAPVELAVPLTGSAAITGLSAAVSDGDAWLTATLDATMLPTTLRLRATPAGLAAGTYPATVTIDATGADNTPIEITVTLDVQAAAGGGTTVIPFRVMNTDPNNADGTDFYASGVIPLTVEDAVRLADFPNIRIRRSPITSDGAEVGAFVDALRTNNTDGTPDAEMRADQGGHVIFHYDAPRDAVGRFTQAEADRPLFGLRVQVSRGGLAFGASGDYIAELHTTPGVARIAERAWMPDAANAPHVTIDATDAKRVTMPPTAIWPMPWGRYATGRLNETAHFTDAPVRWAGGLLPLPEGTGREAAVGAPAYAGVIDATGTTRAVPYFVFYLFPQGAAARWAVATTLPHASDQSTVNLPQYHEAVWVARFVVTVTDTTFEWGVDPLTKAGVTVTQLTWNTAAGTARRAESARTFDGSDANLRSADASPFVPTGLLWCTSADRYCRWNLIDEAVPRAVVATWPGGDHDDRSESQMRWLANQWNFYGPNALGTGGAFYENGRAVVGTFVKDPHPGLLVLLHSVMRRWHLWHQNVTPKYQVQMSHSTPLSWMHTFMLTGSREWSRAAAREAWRATWQQVRPDIAYPTGSRYPIRGGGNGLAAHILGVWRATDFNTDGTAAVNPFTNGLDAWQRGMELIQQAIGWDGEDGTATAHPGFLSDGGQRGLGEPDKQIRDSTNRRVAVQHKTIFAGSGITGEYYADWKRFGAATASAPKAALLTGYYNTYMPIFGRHLVDIDWMGTRLDLGQTLDPPHFGAPYEGIPYPNNNGENGGVRYMPVAYMVSLYGYSTPLPATHGWDPTANGGAGGWVTSGVALTHIPTPEGVGTRAYVLHVGSLYGILCRLLKDFPTYTHGGVNYAAAWRGIQEVLLRRTTLDYMQTSSINANTPFYSAWTGYNGPFIGQLFSSFKTYGEAWRTSGQGERGFAQAKGYPTAV